MSVSTAPRGARLPPRNGFANSPPPTSGDRWIWSTSDRGHPGCEIDLVVEQDALAKLGMGINDGDSRAIGQELGEWVAGVGKPLAESPIHPTKHRREVDLGDVHFRHDDAKAMGVDVWGHLVEAA